jgi:hypothetical protein
MVAGLLITTVYCCSVCLVFFRLRLIRFTPAGASSPPYSVLTSW